MEMKMNRRRKLILINTGIGVGLAIELFRGAGLQAVLIAGVLLFVLANVAMKVREW